MRRGAQVVPPKESCVEMTRRVAAANGVGSVVLAIQGRVEEVALPEASVDIIISEWMGYSEKGEVLLRGVGTLQFFLILSENSACQVPSCAVAA